MPLMDCSAGAGCCRAHVDATAGGAPAEDDKKKSSWLRNSFRRAFGRKRHKRHTATHDQTGTVHDTVNSGTLFARIRSSHHNQRRPYSNHDFPVNHNAGVAEVSNNHGLLGRDATVGRCLAGAVGGVRCQTGTGATIRCHAAAGGPVHYGQIPRLGVNPNQPLRSKSPSSGSKSLDNLDDGCSYTSSARNSEQATPCEHELSLSETATLLRKSLQSKEGECPQLEQELADKQRALTDCQLELLSCQHQLQAQTDTVGRLQKENSSLRCERNRLITLLRKQLGASADALLLQEIGDFSSNDVPDINPDASALAMATLRRTKKCDARSMRVLIMKSSSGLTSSSDATLVDVASCKQRVVGRVNIAPKTNWQQLDEMVYSVVKEFISQTDKYEDNKNLTCGDDKENNSNSNCSVSENNKPDSPDSSGNIYKSLTNDLMKNSLSESNSKYAALTGREANGGTKEEATKWSPNSLIHCFQLAEVVRGTDLPIPDLLPYGYCVGNVQEIRVWLRGGLCSKKNVPQSGVVQNGSHFNASQNCKRNEEIDFNDVASVSFASNIPSSLLLKLTKALAETGRLLMCGPGGSGKSKLANALAQHFAACVAPRTDCAYRHNIRHFTVTGSNSLELCHLLTSLSRRGSSSSGNSASFGCNYLLGQAASSSSLPVAVVIDDLHAASGVAETIQRCLSGTSLGWSPCGGAPAIIATSRSAPDAYSNLVKFCNFSWISLNPETEPLRGMVIRTLRRNILTSEALEQKRLPEAHLVADWLSKLWLKLNVYVKTVCDRRDLVSFTKTPELKFTNNGLFIPNTANFLPCKVDLGISHSQSSFSEAIVTPECFLDCPVADFSESQRWFVRRWNDKIIPLVRGLSKPKNPSGRSHISNSNHNSPANSFYKVQSERETTHSGKDSSSGIEDPLEWVLETYPWRDTPECQSHQLSRVEASSGMATTVMTKSEEQHRIFPSDAIYAVPLQASECEFNNPNDSLTSKYGYSKGLLRNNLFNSSEGTSQNGSYDKNSYNGTHSAKTTCKDNTSSKLQVTQHKVENLDVTVANTSLESSENQDLPASMELIVPYSSSRTSAVDTVKPNQPLKKSTKGVPNGYYPDLQNDKDIYKSLKSFGNVSTGIDKREILPVHDFQQHRKMVCKKTSSTGVQQHRVNPFADVIVEEDNETNPSTYAGIRNQHSFDRSAGISSKCSYDLGNTKRISCHSVDSDEAMDTPSPTTSSGDAAEPIYLALQRRSTGSSKSNSSVGSGSDMDTLEPIYSTISTDGDSTKAKISPASSCERDEVASNSVQQRHTSTTLPLNTFGIHNDVQRKAFKNFNGVLGDTVAIVCQANNLKMEARGLTNELTSSFKPVETSM